MQKPGSTESVQPTIALTTTAREARWLKMLIYGEHGAGKTTLAASARDVSEMNDVLLIDVEGGDLSLAGADIDRIGVSSYGQLARTYEFLRLHCRLRDSGAIDKLVALETQLRPGAEVKKPRQWRTVVVDSLSEVQKYCMYQLLGIRIGERALDLIPGSPGLADWNQAAEMIRLLVRSFRDLPMHVVFVAAEQIQEDERKQLHRRPALPGKLGGEVQGFFDIVGYLHAAPAEDGSKVQRRLFLQPGRTFQAKTRFADCTVPYLDNPTMAALHKLNLTKGKGGTQ